MTDDRQTDRQTKPIVLPLAHTCGVNIAFDPVENLYGLTLSAFLPSCAPDPLSILTQLRTIDLLSILTKLYAPTCIG